MTAINLLFSVILITYLSVLLALWFLARYSRAPAPTEDDLDYLWRDEPMEGGGA